MPTSNHVPGTVFEECPTCGSDIFDNRDKIESGEYNAKSPHFVCKEKVSCGWASWPERAQKGGRGAARAPKGTSSARTVSGPLTGGYSTADLVALHKSIYGAVGYVKQERTAAAATIFIKASGSGLGPIESLDDTPKALKKEKDDLPFPDGDPGMEE